MAGDTTSAAGDPGGAGDLAARHWHLPPSASAAATVRNRLHVLMTGWGVSEDSCDRAMLIVTELVSNVVDHAHTPLTVTVRPDGGMLHVHVQDGSALPPALQPLDPLAVRGRGLQMIDALTTRWGWTLEGTGKTVWAVVDLADEAQHR
ncbi:ATP-binding protein [Pseudonocardia sp. GCM10023141]|uniref:ATP-binding protein n=1 Tax=Pseudonocardia sp. GCM10023141 TaxID=3252653 RepID=UPI00362217FC